MLQDDFSQMEQIEEVRNANAGADDQSGVLLNLEELIKNHIEQIDKLGVELKKIREMFDDSFDGDPVYRKNREDALEAAKGEKSVRQQIMRQPQVMSLGQKLKDMRSERNELGKTLSDLLQNYKEMTGATQIEGRDGQMRDIVSIAKLIKRNSKHNT